VPPKGRGRGGGSRRACATSGCASFRRAAARLHRALQSALPGRAQILAQPMKAGVQACCQESPKAQRPPALDEPGRAVPRGRPRAPRDQGPTQARGSRHDAQRRESPPGAQSRAPPAPPTTTGRDASDRQDAPERQRAAPLGVLRGRLARRRRGRRPRHHPPQIVKRRMIRPTNERLVELGPGRLVQPRLPAPPRKSSPLTPPNCSTNSSTSPPDSDDLFSCASMD
jgi:hypothetical protein